ncbi:hypothetical protein TURU_011352 [Turdus rufiventris]|nr:hypothetical protein TURU_011352 [Turdus rufiventris]
MPEQWLCSRTCVCRRTSDMEQDQANPNSQDPRPSPSPPRAQGWREQQEEDEVGARRGRRGALHGDILFVSFDSEEGLDFCHGEMQGTPGETCVDPELCPGDVCRPHELCDCHECLEPEMSPGGAGTFHNLCDCDECLKPKLYQGEMNQNQRGAPGETCADPEMCPGCAGTSHIKKSTKTPQKMPNDKE